MKKILLISSFLFAIAFNSNAQGLYKLKQGAAGDTLKASTTYTTVAVNLNTTNVQIVSGTIAIDSISGNPGGIATLEQSVDGTHWNTTGSTWDFNFQGTGTHSGLVSLNPFLGAYVRVKIVTDATAQKSKYYITLRSANRSE